MAYANQPGGVITTPELMAVYLASQEDVFRYLPGGISVTCGWENEQQLQERSRAPGGATRLMAICTEVEEIPSNIRGQFFVVASVMLWCTSKGDPYEQIYLLQSCYYVRDLFNEANISSLDFSDFFNPDRGTKRINELRYMGRTHVPKKFSGMPWEIYNLTFVCAQSGVKWARDVARNTR